MVVNVTEIIEITGSIVGTGGTEPKFTIKSTRVEVQTEMITTVWSRTDMFIEGF